MKQSLHVKAVMRKQPCMVRGDHTVRHAARVMRDIGCGIVPVLDSRELVMGMLTDRDLVLRVIAAGKDASKTLVREVMTPEVRSCEEDDTLEAAADKMIAHHVGRLIVTHRGKVTGIVTLAELLRNIGDEGISRRVLHHLLQMPKPETADIWRIDEACL